MKNHVNYETAVRLKEAGFPQPTPEFGQVWWYVGEKPERAVITYVYQSGKIDFCIEGGTVWMVQSIFSNMVFAPTALDISETCYFLNAANELVNEQLPNPSAEAAALAWLKLNKKKAENE